MTQPIEDFCEIMCVDIASPEAREHVTAPPRDGKCPVQYVCAMTQQCHLELAAKARFFS